MHDSSIALKCSMSSYKSFTCETRFTCRRHILLVVKKCVKGRKEREKHIIETGGKKERSGLDKSRSITALTSNPSSLSQLMVALTAQALII